MVWAILVGSFSVLGATSDQLSSPASADGPAPCSTGSPPFAFAGFCATYAGDNTWYGTYGPGFPTAQGWALCANRPASGESYPAPGYHYVPGGAPAGAGGDWNALGFAFSEGQGNGYWSGQVGEYTSNQAAAAAKLLYDQVVWGSPTGSMDPGVNAAYGAFASWYREALGMSASPPQLSVGLVGGGSTFGGSATDDIHLQFPGTGAPLIGQPLLLSITNGTFNSATGPTTIGTSTDSNGNALATIYAAGTGVVAVTVKTSVGVGQPGLGFYHQSSGPGGAQTIAGFPAPTALSASQSLSGSNPSALPQGTLSIQKAGNDTAYYGLAGATFDVYSATALVAQLTISASGASPPSAQLDPGTYTVREVTAPFGYQLAADQQATVVGLENTVVNYSGADQELIIPATVTIEKLDAETDLPLAGAVFDVKYATSNGGAFDEDLGECTTAATGSCTPAGNDGSALLPGKYQISEVSAPTGYYLDPTRAVQTISLSPGQNGAVSFSDEVLGSLSVSKTGNDPAYYSVAGAVFTVTGPSPSSLPIGSLVVGANGQSNTLSGLLAGSYTLTETTVPSGYQPIAPLTVVVNLGHATTDVSVPDLIQPSTVTIFKVDAATQAPLAGAIFDTKFDPAGSGDYSMDLGDCTTGASGQCSPTGNDGGDLLPGDYQITEITAPPGYLVDPTTASQTVTLEPGVASSLTFDDHLLVPASFKKVAVGNFDPAEVLYSGAVLNVYQGSASGPLVATCTTDSSGLCVTGSVLESASTYCWSEVQAPPGLEAGAGGCFVASNAQAGEPITVVDPGLFVNIEAKKVDEASIGTGLPGAVLDLYRVDDGAGPDAPPPPASAQRIAGQTWVGRAVTNSEGLAVYAPQFPGYAYCVMEQSPPANYELNPLESCTSVLSGSAIVPAPIVTITETDHESLVSLVATKYNSLIPDTGIPNAIYDLFIQGAAPPSGIPSTQPADVQPVTGDTWFARRTTDADGRLTFALPAGYAWCLREVTAPLDYNLDPAVHCTAVINSSGPSSVTNIALPEIPATVNVSAIKYDSLQPNTVIAGASYALFAKGTVPAGYDPPVAPPSVAVPAGTAYWSEGSTDSAGNLTFSVPAGYAWCLQETLAPPGYQRDTALHCTGVLTTESIASAASLALPELPIPPPGLLAYTGGPPVWIAEAGLLLVVAGGVIWGRSRRRRHG